MMTTDPDLRVEMSGSDIVITMPETSYTVTYYRAAGSRQILARRFSMKGDPRVAMTVSEFLIRAWKLADNKARTLGWMVQPSPRRPLRQIAFIEKEARRG